MSLSSTIVPLLILSGIYIAVLSATVALLRRAKVDLLSKRVELLAFATFGLLTGLLAALLWPYDSSIYANVPGVLLADELYQWATRTIAPGATDPHHHIPWPLRIPQSYVWVSTGLWSILGLIIQWVARHRSSSSRQTS